MAITIYKIAYHVDWDGTGVARPRAGGVYGGSSVEPVDLSNYYTKENLFTADQSEIHFANIIEAYHNELLGLQGGDDDSSGDSSGFIGDYYHLDEATYYDIVGISFQMSIEKDSNNVVTLVNDEVDPGVSKYYGTDGAGDKGWYDLPSGTLPFQTESFADPLNIDCTTYKDWICTVTDDCTVNLNNVSDGDAGMLELIIEADSSGGEVVITFGDMWTKKMGPEVLDMTDGADNIVSWRAIGEGSTQEIVYTIGVIEV